MSLSNNNLLMDFDDEYYDDADYDDENDEIYDQIYDDEERLGEEPECENGKYYLCSVFLMDRDNICSDELLIDKRMDKRLFFKYTYSHICEYTHMYYPKYYYSKGIEIVQAVLVNDCYTAIIKTFWIKIIQRAWKRTFEARKQWLNNFKKNVLNNMNAVQQTGKLPEPYPKFTIYT